MFNCANGPNGWNAYDFDFNILVPKSAFTLRFPIALFLSGTSFSLRKSPGNNNYNNNYSMIIQTEIDFLQRITDREKQQASYLFRPSSVAREKGFSNST